MVEEVEKKVEKDLVGLTSFPTIIVRSILHYAYVWKVPLYPQRLWSVLNLSRIDPPCGSVGLISAVDDTRRHPKVSANHLLEGPWRASNVNQSLSTLEGSH